MPRTTVRQPRIDSFKPSGVQIAYACEYIEINERALLVEESFFVSYGHGIFLGIRPHQLYTKKTAKSSLFYKSHHSLHQEQHNDLFVVVFFVYSWGGPMPKKILGVWGLAPNYLKPRRRLHSQGNWWPQGQYEKGRCLYPSTADFF